MSSSQKRYIKIPQCTENGTQKTCHAPKTGHGIIAKCPCCTDNGTRFIKKPPYMHRKRYILYKKCSHAHRKPNDKYGNFEYKVPVNLWRFILLNCFILISNCFTITSKAIVFILISESYQRYLRSAQYKQNDIRDISAHEQYALPAFELAHDERGNYRKPRDRKTEWEIKPQ